MVQAVLTLQLRIVNKLLTVNMFFPVTCEENYSDSTVKKNKKIIISKAISIPKLNIHSFASTFKYEK